MSSFFEFYLTFCLFKIPCQSLPSNKNAVSGKNIRWVYTLTDGCNLCNF